MIALITEIELGLLSPKMERKVLSSTLMFISSVKRISERVTPCGSCCNIEKYYYLLLKLKPKVSDIYISFVIYTGNYCFHGFNPCTCFRINKFTFTQKNHVIARAFRSCYFLSLAVNSL